MFGKNTRHWQIPLTSHVDELPEPLRRRLENSWAGTFYREFFSRLAAGPFAVLYSDLISRPNVPVNVLVGLEFLKAANGWTDEAMYDHFCDDVQVRYALGYRQLRAGYFDLRTLDSFRERLAHHAQETGENLLERAVEQVTGEPLRAFSIKTGQQRMDSTLLAANIRQMGRIQRLVTVRQRGWRMLSAADQQRYAQRFEPYLKGHPGQYLYRLKKEAWAEHLQRIGEDMRTLLQELQAAYGEQPTYAVLARVFAEHFRLEKEKLPVKEAGELSARSLPSPDDLEATYREKHGQSSRGYVTNLTETCDPHNPLQLVTKVQVAPNVSDDSALLAEALPDLKVRTGLAERYTDGAYGSAENDKRLAEQEVTLIQSAIRGRKRKEERLYLDDCTLLSDLHTGALNLTCPHGQHVPVRRTNLGQSYRATVDAQLCGNCPLQPRFRCSLANMEKLYCSSRRKTCAGRSGGAGCVRQPQENGTCVLPLKRASAGSSIPSRGQPAGAKTFSSGLPGDRCCRRDERAADTPFPAEPDSRKSADRAGKKDDNTPGRAGGTCFFSVSVARFCRPLDVTATSTARF
ncbi:MAG: transposase [Chloroflexi bacterium]|nr:MAG: transposase [Chloroflexota bacterium]